MSHFSDIADHWRTLGFACLPSKGIGDKTPRGGITFAHLHGDDRVAPTDQEWREFAAVGEFLDSEPLLITVGLPGSDLSLVAIDGDHPDVWPWIEAEVGPTPLHIETGRVGGGRHYWYRTDDSIPMSSATIGPATPAKIRIDEESGREQKGTYVDVRAVHGYVVAPGARHKSGLVYTAMWNGVPIDWRNITRDMLMSLPVLTRARYDEIRAVAPFAGQRWSGSTSTIPSSFSDGGAYPREREDSKKSVPEPGPYAGFSVAQAAQAAGVGATKIGCPFHPSTSGRSATLHVWEDGGFCVSCHVDRVTYTFNPSLSGHSAIFGVSRTEKRGTTISDIKDQKGRGAPDRAASNAEESILSRLESATLSTPISGRPWDHSAVDRMTLSDLDLRSDGVHLPTAHLRTRLTFVRAPWGRGKTHLLSSLLHSMPRHVGPVLSVVHRRTLAQQQADRLRLPNYQNIQGEIYGDVVVCLDSLRRVRLAQPDESGELRVIRHSLVILDEVVSLIHHLYGGTLSGPQSVAAYEHLRTIMTHAERVICLDADLDGDTIKWVRHLCGIQADDPSNQELRWLDVPPEPTYRVDVDQARTDTDLIAEWTEGKRLAVHCQSRTEAHAKAKVLAEINPDAKILLVSSETVIDADKPEVKEFLADPALADKYDALIYSPTLGTGYSVDVRGHFHRIYVYSREMVRTVHALMQGAHRVRHPIDPEIRICCPPTKSIFRERNPEKIYTALLALGDSTIRSFTPSGPVRTGEMVPGSLVVDDDGVMSVDPWRTSHTRLYTQILSHERRFGGPGGDRRGALLGYLASIGATVTETEAVLPDESKDVREQAKEARAAVREERSERVASASEVPIDEIQDRPEPTTLQEADEAERSRILDFYPDDYISQHEGGMAGVVHDDDEGELRAHARNFARVRLSVSNPATLVRLDKREREQGVPASHAGFHSIQARSIRAICKAAGLVGDPSTWGGQTVDPLVTGPAIAKIAKSLRPVLGEMGIGVRRDVDTAPTRLVSAVLRKIGVRLDEKKVEGNRSYQVSTNSVERMSLVSSRYEARIRRDDPLGEIEMRPEELQQLMAD